MYMVVDKQRNVRKPVGIKLTQECEDQMMRLNLSLLEVSIPKEASSTRRGRKEIIALKECCSLSQNAAGNSEDDQCRQEETYRRCHGSWSLAHLAALAAFSAALAALLADKATAQSGQTGRKS
jgi:hypothetical protein